MLIVLELAAQPLYQSRLSLVLDAVMGPNTTASYWQVLPSYQMNIGTSEKDFNVYGTLRGRGYLPVNAKYAFGAGIAVNLAPEIRISCGGLVDENHLIRGQVGLDILLDKVTLDVSMDNRFSSEVIKKSRIGDYWIDARLMFHSKTGTHKMAIGLMARSHDGLGGRGEVEMLGGLYLTGHMLWDPDAPKDCQLKMGAGLTLRY